LKNGPSATDLKAWKSLETYSFATLIDEKYSEIEGKKQLFNFFIQMIPREQFEINSILLSHVLSTT
jgi:hypothetical protein